MTTNIDTAHNISNHFYQLEADLDDAFQRELTIQDGELHHHIDLSKYPPADQAKIEEALTAIAEKLDALKEAAQKAGDNGDGLRATELYTDARELSARVTELAEEIEAGELNVEGLQGYLLAETPEPQPVRVTVASEESAGAMDDATGATGSTGATSGESDNPTAAFQRVTEDVAGAVERFESDPKAFFAELKQMTSPERSIAMQSIQNEIQANNQLMSMLSNFHQAMHDTQKAVIANLRV